MVEKSWPFITMIVISVAASITCLVMSIVFAYDISLVYPNPIVNVANVTNLATGVNVLQFYLRCDQANGGSAAQDILSNCGISSFIIVPRCNLIAPQSYYYQTFAFGSVATCPPGYLQSIGYTVNLGINLVALASVMMIIGAIVVWIPFIIIMCYNS